MNYPLILQEICYTCKYYEDKTCRVLNIEPKTPEVFCCDFFKRKNSGAFRRKWRKAKKKYEEYERRSNESKKNNK